MTAYYSEFDPYAAQWLRNLIAAGRIAPGDVDERDLWDVTPDDIKTYTQVHFCAGIGIWSCVLRANGWDDSRPVWTASFPCQPFSEAGKGLGFADERHLWPAGYHLIRERQPAIILGEQSASPLGRGWMELVQADLEDAGYAVGAVTTCAAGFGATPGRGYHLRHRQYWCARRLGDADIAGPQGQRIGGDGSGERPVGAGSVARGVADAPSPRRGRKIAGSEGNSRDETRLRVSCEECGPRGVAIPHGERRLRWTHDADEGRRVEVSGPGGASGGVGNSAVGNPVEHALLRAEQEHPVEAGGRGATGEPGVDLIYCTDNRWRPVEVGTFPLADADSNRVGKLRAYGNALDAAQAQAFVAAVLECEPG